MFHFKRRRTLIRLLSFGIAVVAVLAGFAGTGFWMAYKYRMNIEYSYQRALSELSEHVDNIDVTLQKGIYAGTSTQLVGLSSQVWSEAEAAKTNLSQMPLANVNLDNTNRFVTQVGDYANTLGKQAAANEKVTDDERANIVRLSNYAKSLSSQLEDTITEIQSGRITLFKSKNALYNTSAQRSAMPTLSDSFKNIENTFTGLPSLIYDGPFSDNIQKKSPQLIQGKAQVSKAQAQKTAADFLKVPVSGMRFSGEAGGSLPTWNFTSGNTSVSVSKAGGLTVRMLNTRASSSGKLDTGAAAAKARDYLAVRGIQSMTETYYLTSNNICTINFAYNLGGVTCYTDLIKLGVALDNGEIISYDATGYIMNHHTRSLPAAKVSQDSAKALLSPLLKVQKVSLAVIPINGAGESYCYEFKCTGNGGQTVVDYFNTQTGLEQQLLILESTPGGMLAM